MSSVSSVPSVSSAGSAPPSASSAITASTTDKIEKRKADPLLYIIIFAILFLITLGLLTWVLDVYNKQLQCAANPNLWCSDKWTCTQTCQLDPNTNACVPPQNQFQTGQPTPVNPCFCAALGTTGLASCLYGVDAPGGKNCLNPGFDSDDVGDCTCPAEIVGTTINCFQGCPQNLDDLTSSTTACCCNPDNYDVGSALYTYCLNQAANCANVT